MSNTTRWAGVSLSDRRTERRALLIAAAYDLLGTDLLGHDPSALSVRALCRASGLNSRYFYESFADLDELLGELYDEVAADLAGVVAAAIECAGPSVRSRTAAGIRAVLGHAGDDPRRGAILFTHARANPVLAARRVATEELLMSSVLAETVRQQGDRTSRPMADQVGAVMFAGAMAELARQWLGGHLGSDLDVVVDAATAFVLRSAPART
ncbi:TetR/AcrR family transcriptional regulator [Gordonia sp. L191]|uniref:TetR/AcrR family transcriptional regulator n=1 Tax=Gordonia sp. L191 TaxID=2982699 RepID=UPI0024C0D277|nr:TetR/AcrR family transcriptional regulator [Gordonia sp. L191]WHU48693.1 TetR/AcrR family transcriptional regulator [Gordonia sp. L191]